MRIAVVAGLAGIAAFAAGVAVSSAQDLPHQKPGLWQQDMTMMGTHVSDQACIDAATEAKMSVFSHQMSHKNCKSQNISHNMDGSWTIVSTCAFGPGAEKTSRADVSGDFNSKINMTVRTPPKTTPDMVMTSVWTGPCKPGQRGGDVIMSNGMKMNMLDSMSAAPPGPPPH
jgi:hypothetical protein